MFYIAICDDEEIICEQIAKQIEEYCKFSCRDIAVKVYESGEALYNELEEGRHFDLVFLDIELHKLNGIKVGNLIRTTLENHLVQIVYISARKKYAMDLFAVHPLDFLPKPIEPTKIDDCINLALKMGKKTPDYFSYQVNEITTRVLLSDILYFESSTRKIRLYSTKHEDEFYGSLDVIYAEIKKFDFLRIHKSYIINYLRVKTNTLSDMVLDNGKKLPISRSRQKNISEELLRMATKGVVKWN